MHRDSMSVLAFHLGMTITGVAALKAEAAGDDEGFRLLDSTSKNLAEVAERFLYARRPPPVAPAARTTRPCR